VQAWRLINQHQPDVALIESSMSIISGFELAEHALRKVPHVHVILLSSHADRECMKRASGCGADGYLTMNDSPANLELAIRTVVNAKRHAGARATKELVNFVRRDPFDDTSRLLTPRQREVLKLIAEGKSTKQIALILNISVKTVESHRALLTTRLDIRHVAGLVRYAIKSGLIHLET
jgi:DNA-binding NarL/FixJ family response regulator